MRYCNKAVTSWVQLLFTFLLPLLLWFSQALAQMPLELAYHFKEETAIGTKIGNLLTDTELNKQHPRDIARQLHFQFLGEAKKKTFFRIDHNNHDFVVNKRIDREAICRKQSECVLYVDIGVLPAQYFQVIKVAVHVLDINDNRPVFEERHLTFELLESAQQGHSITLPPAVDLDTGRYGVQQYALEPRIDAFQLRTVKNLDTSVHLYLILKKKLSRSKRQKYTIKIVATDGGAPARSGFLDVTIFVKDANDHSPVFRNTSYTITIPENLPINSNIIQVHADDPDEGMFGQIVYTLSKTTIANYGHLFGINSKNGIIFVKGLIDYEQKEMYHLVVEARDKGKLTLPADTTVIVQIQDKNDLAPVMAISTINNPRAESVTIAEDVAIGSFIAHVTVEDKDSGHNGRFSCYLDSPAFELQQLQITEYQVTSRMQLDREKQAEYDLELMCRDMGAKPQVSKKNLKVILKDVNDCAPKFTKRVYHVRIRENNFMGAFLIQVNATDADEGRNAVVSYMPGRDMAGKAEVDGATGAISATTVFDREKQKTFQFLILAHDAGVPSLTATSTVVVRVLDDNDQGPKFDKIHYVFNVAENLPEDTVVGVVKATDKDSSANNQLEYTLLPSSRDAQTHFHLQTQSGRILTRRPLDREEKREFNFLIMVMDSGSPPLNSQCSVVVKVVDVNDQAPRILFPTLFNDTIEISSATPRDYVIERIRASDSDSGPNGKLSYRIASGNSKRLLALDVKTGDLSVAKALVHLEYHVIHLVLAVKDGGVPPQTTSAKLNIIIRKSIPFHGLGGAQSRFLLRSNIKVAAIGIISVVILLILVITLVMLAKRQKQTKGSKGQGATTHNSKVVADKQKNETSSVTDHLLKKETVSFGNFAAPENKPRKGVSFSFEVDDFRDLETPTDDIVPCLKNVSKKAAPGGPDTTKQAIYSGALRQKDKVRPTSDLYAAGGPPIQAMPHGPATASPCTPTAMVTPTFRRSHSYASMQPLKFNTFGGRAAAPRPPVTFNPRTTLTFLPEPPLIAQQQQQNRRTACTDSQRGYHSDTESCRLQQNGRTPNKSHNSAAGKLMTGTAPKRASNCNTLPHRLGSSGKQKPKPPVISKAGLLLSEDVHIEATDV